MVCGHGYRGFFGGMGPTGRFSYITSAVQLVEPGVNISL
jgi:hypothetical protein